MNTGDRQKHSIPAIHGLICRDELWRRHQSLLWILEGDFTVNGSISPDLFQCACFCYEDLWAEVHTCSLEVWACHGSHSYKHYPDSLPTRTFTLPKRMVSKLRRPNLIRNVHMYISVRKNVLAWKTSWYLLPSAAISRADRWKYDNCIVHTVQFWHKTYTINRDSRQTKAAVTLHTTSEYEYDEARIRLRCFTVCKEPHSDRHTTKLYPMHTQKKMAQANTSVPRS